jgi:protein TonB
MPKEPDAPQPKEVPLAAAEPIALAPATGQGVAVAVGSPDGVAGAKPVTGVGPAPTTTNVSPTSKGDVFDPRGYRDSLYDLINKQKRYPTQAQHMGQQGTVLVKFRIDETGNLVGEPTVIGLGSGSSLLDGEALRMVKAAAPFPRPHGEGAHFPITQTQRIEFSLIGG